MNNREDEDFKKNWEEAYRENQQMDQLTDARIKAGIEQRIQTGKNRKKIFWAASAAAVVIGMGMFFYKPSEPSSIVEPAKVETYISSDFTKPIDLPDGSHIVLEPHSRLVLSSDFGKTDRRITFTGKATFDIAKDKTRPFRINAKDFTVQVLGTKFFLDQTTGKEKVELFEGKVKVDHHGKITYLLPNQSWSKNIEKPVHFYYAADAKREFSFEDESLKNIVAELEQVYNIKIEYPKEYGDQKIKGSFSGNLNEVLSAICYPFNLKTEKKSDKEIQLK
ncbi:FecR family protein [Chryseobacterium sp. c4a]|uniref:FecR family protein n=1 Tax=Chryseobacterium sp. c4a TaxID=1573582 RepID=UPI00135875A4|nr:FecR family protein [Chryseobacterium sp. c4a]